MAVRFLSISSSLFSGLFLSFFHEIPFKMAFFKLRYMTFFLTHATTLRTLISYFDSREKYHRNLHFLDFFIFRVSSLFILLWCFGIFSTQNRWFC